MFYWHFNIHNFFNLNNIFHRHLNNPHNLLLDNLFYLNLPNNINRDLNNFPPHRHIIIARIRLTIIRIYILRIQQPLQRSWIHIDLYTILSVLWLVVLLTFPTNSQGLVGIEVVLFMWGVWLLLCGVVDFLVGFVVLLLFLLGSEGLLCWAVAGLGGSKSTLGESEMLLLVFVGVLVGVGVGLLLLLVFA